MKRLLLLMFTATLTLTNCSSDNDRDDTKTEVQDFTNANYIKSKMVGKWNVYAYEPTSGFWNNLSLDQYYQFKNDGTYTYKSSLSTDLVPLENGTYTITAATAKDNAYLLLKYENSAGTNYRTVYLQDLTDNIVTIKESDSQFRYKYKKE